MALVRETKDKNYGQEEKKNLQQKTQTTQLYKSQPAVTYLGLFQTSKSFKQVSQVTTHAIKILPGRERSFYSHNQPPINVLTPNMFLF